MPGITFATGMEHDAPAAAGSRRGPTPCDGGRLDIL
jgi:hypothetical protein